MIDANDASAATGCSDSDQAGDDVRITILAEPGRNLAISALTD